MWLWAAIAFLVTGTLASGHLYTLPHPDRNDRTLQAALAAQRGPEELGRFSVTHVMYAECRCSQRIIDHLERRGAREDLTEHVVLVGRDDALERRLTRAGFKLSNVTPIELKRKYALEAAPLLIITNAQGAIAYMGGYTTQKQGLDVRDVALIDDSLRGKGTYELPLLGCAVSRALQRVLDPFALKYGSQDTDEK